MVAEHKTNVIQEPNIPGWFSLAQLNFVCDCIQRFNAKQCLEIGTFMGRSSYAICSALQAIGGDRLVCIDTFASPLSENYFKLPFMQTMMSRYPSDIVHQYSDYKRLPTTLDCFRYTMSRYPFMQNFVEINQGDSKQVDLKQDKFDFILLDGDHTYDGVKADFNQVYPHAKDGSIIMFDDYSEHFPGVQKFVSEIETQSTLILVDCVQAAIAFQVKQ